MLREQMLGSWLWDDTLVPLSCFDFEDRVFFNAVVRCHLEVNV